MAWPWWVLLAVVVVVVGLWLADRAPARPDDHRIEVSRAALDAQLLRRSGVAVELATSGTLDPARSLLLVDAAHGARGRPGRASRPSRPLESLRAVRRLPRGRADVGPLLEELAACCHKVVMARRFHRGRSARALRSRRRVRWPLVGAPSRTVDLDGYRRPRCSPTDRTGSVPVRG